MTVQPKSATAASVPSADPAHEEYEGAEVAAGHAQGDEPHYLRWPRSDRIEHIILICSFSTLAFTGIPQKYASVPFMQTWIELMGGIETVRIIHRWAAAVLILGSIWHIAMMGYKVYVKRVRLTLLPGLNDVRDAIQALGYNVRLLKNPPRMGKYNFAEKAEYWALLWGTVVMMITGYMLWNPIATTAILPGEMIPVARTAHGLEAVLAVLSILTWHVYHVHVKRFNKSMFTGYMGREEMEEEHALELEAIEKHRLPPPQKPEDVRRRSRIYMPIAGVMVVFLFLATYFFLTFEDTAIETIPTPIPAGQVGLNVPLTPVPPSLP
jgi:formate dehydrogenase gamma subunit